MMTNQPQTAFCDPCGQPLRGAYCDTCGAMAAVAPSAEAISQHVAESPPHEQVVPREILALAAPRSTPSQNVTAPGGSYCPSCGAAGQTLSFCASCGAQLGGSSDSAITAATTRRAGGQDSATQPSGTADAGRVARDVDEIWAATDKGDLKLAAIRTGSAWIVVWLLLLALSAVVTAVGGDEVGTVTSLAAGLQLLGLGSTASFASLVSASMILVTVGMLQWLALRLAQVRRPDVSNMRAYAVASSAVSAIAVFALVTIASTSGLTWSWFIPVLIAVGLTLLAIFGLPLPQRFPELKTALAAAGRLTVITLWITLVAATAGIVVMSLDPDSGISGLGNALGLCLLTVLLIPNFAIVMLASALGIPVTATGYIGTLSGGVESGAILPWWASALLLAIILLTLAYWLTSENRLRPSASAWRWIGGVFAFSGILFAWISRISLDITASAQVGVEPLQFAWRLGLLGVVTGLVVHPAVLPTVLKWRAQVPRVNTTSLVPQRLREIGEEATDKQPVLGHVGAALGRPAQAILWGVVALFVLAILAVAAGGLLNAGSGASSASAGFTEVSASWSDESWATPVSVQGNAPAALQGALEVS